VIKKNGNLVKIWSWSGREAEGGVFIANKEKCLGTEQADLAPTISSFLDIKPIQYFSSFQQKRTKGSIDFFVFV
jgi:hypothetical protein